VTADQVAEQIAADGTGGDADRGAIDLPLSRVRVGGAARDGERRQRSAEGNGPLNAHLGLQLFALISEIGVRRAYSPIANERSLAANLV
jgi:hypothetical protein